MSLIHARAQDVALVNENRFGGALGVALNLAVNAGILDAGGRLSRNNPARADGAENADDVAWYAPAIERWDRDLANRMRADGYKHRADGDDLRVDAGYFFSRETEYVFPEMDTRLTALNARKLMPLVSVPVGARTYKHGRLTLSGKAVVHRAGEAIPMSDFTREEEDWPIHHLVAGFQIDYFEQQTATFAGVAVAGNRARAAARAMDEKENALLFGRSGEGQPFGLYGLFDHPDIARVQSPVEYSSASTPDEILQDLLFWMRWPSVNSKEVFGVNKAWASKRLRDYLAGRRMGSGDGALTILQSFLAVNGVMGANDISTAHELQDVIGDGWDAIVFSRNSPEALAIMSQGSSFMLPITNEGTNTVFVMARPFGGIRSLDSGDVLIVYVYVGA